MLWKPSHEDMRGKAASCIAALNRNWELVSGCKPGWTRDDLRGHRAKIPRAARAATITSYTNCLESWSGRGESNARP